jgi:hypothetical protein
VPGKLKKTRAQAGLVKILFNYKKRIIDSLSSRNTHVVRPALDFPGMSLHSSCEPMWIFLIKPGIFFLFKKNFPKYYRKNRDNAAACMSLSSKASLKS